MQLSRHIGKAVWSTAGKLLYVALGIAFLLPRKVIGPESWGVYAVTQALLTSVFTLSDSFALQAMVNFGMEESRRKEAYSVAALLHLAFVVICTAAVYLGRTALAAFFDEPALLATLDIFPFFALGFLLRNFFLKVAQLHIDTRATFIIDFVWVGGTLALIVHGWLTGTLVTARDMIVIMALSSGASSLMGLALFGRKVRFTTGIDGSYAIRMVRFGIAQLGSAVTLVLQTQGDALILKAFVSSAVVGNYDAAKSFFRGFEAIRDAGALFVYPAVAKLAVERRRAELVLLLEKMIGFMLIVVTPVVIAVWVGPTDYIFDLIYKGKFGEAATIFKILSLAALAIPFSMNTHVLGGLGQARRYFRVTLAAALLSVLASLVLVPWIGARGTAIAMIVSFVALGVLATRAVRQSVPFSLRSAFGRWRDALNFVLKLWHRVAMRSGGRRGE